MSLSFEVADDVGALALEELEGSVHGLDAAGPFAVLEGVEVAFGGAAASVQLPAISFQRSDPPHTLRFRLGWYARGRALFARRFAIASNDRSFGLPTLLRFARGQALRSTPLPSG